MLSLSRIIFFIKQYQKQLQKKWKSLPLLLLFPILIIGLCFFVMVSMFFTNDEEKQAIQVGLVDHDQSDETTMLVKVIDDSSLLGSYIHINHYSESEALRAIENGNASGYITFPENFTDDLYNGRSVEIPIVGNPDNPVESYIIKELIDSMTRYIASAQANILTINEYAKQLPIETEDRQEMLMQQFNQFMLFTLSKDKIIELEEITNLTTSSPLQYFTLAGWFVLFTVWIVSLYILLGKEDSIAMRNRMKLYGITIFQRTISRITIVLFYGLILAMVSFYSYIKIFTIEFYLGDYARIGLLVLLHSVIFLFGIAILELLIKSEKASMLVQIAFTGLTLLLSGAIIPALYFPEKLKSFLPYIYSTESFNWLIEVAIKGRLYAEFLLLFILAIASFFILTAIAMWKERAA
ncbi:ABC transporter permease [Aquibacillus kalidii]|uniref:ABC transporter permease n=1 Tax=Aquibacillus kalidii TaxID=2762597 RepID=UPI0016475CA8|nr:ABC transporter permease [Aquibacillus kalidii]